MSREVPAFTADVYAPPAHPYVLCLPVLNENGRVHAQLERLKPFLSLVDLIIADGGSTDGSTAAGTMRSMGARALLTKTGPGRLSAQLRMALAWSLDQGYAGVILMDGNNKDDPSAIPSFISALESGVDHVQGSRYIPGGRAVNTPFLRHWGVQLIHAPLISLSAGHRYTDTTNGFRAYSRRLLEHQRVQPFRDIFMNYELHYYLAIQAGRLGFRIREVPVTREYPSAGPTPTKISGWKGYADVLAGLLKAAFRKYDVI